MATSTPKPRSIDFLRPDQLERKREGDRRSQALLRARNKAYVKELEGRIEELEGQVRVLEAELQSQRSCFDAGTSIEQIATPPQDSNCDILSIQDVSIEALADENSFWTRILDDSILLPAPAYMPDTISIQPTASSPVYVPLAPSSWTTLPKHIAPTCALDHVITTLIATRRQHELTGGNMAEFQRDSFPSVQSLLNPSSSTTVTAPVTSTIVRDIIHVMTVPTLPEQIAILYVMSTVIRWHISPTRANYASIPPWLRPTPAQLMHPHAPWIDMITWPRVRDRFVQYPRYQNAHDTMARLCNESLSINWALQPGDMFMSVGGADRPDIVLNPIFERHIRNIDNWTVSQSVVDVYPELAGEINIGKPRNANSVPL